jgi:drug/metabolite transporter (DMT)-like permease
VIYTAAFLVLSVFLIFSDKELSWSIPPFAGGVALLFGVLMGAGTLTFYAAYRYGKATIVTPYVLLYPLITVLVALPLYGEKIDLVRGTGIFFAVAACVLLSIEKKADAAAPGSAAPTANFPGG